MRVTLDDQGKLAVSDFTPLEAYHIALHLEERGLDFYERLASRATDPALHAAFVSLLETERSHSRTFRALLEEEAAVADVSPEAHDLSHYLEPGVFRLQEDPDRLLAGIDEPEKVLDLGIRIEEEVIAFYEDLLRRTQNAGGRRALTEILDEEREHLARLMNMGN